MSLKIILLFPAVLISATILAQESKTKKELREENKQSDYLYVQELVSSANFTFIATKAYPQSGSMIDLTNNSGFVDFRKDSVVAHLPFFGRSYSGGYSTTDGGIKFSAIAEGWSITKNDEKKKLTIEFSIKEGVTTYNCVLSAFSVNSVTLSVVISSKSSISYSGIAKVLQEE